MAHNNAASLDVTDENDPLSKAPTWTVPSDRVANSDGHLLMPSDDKSSVAASEYPTPSAPDITDFPPNYFDISIVPNSAILHYNEIVPFTEPSKAQIERQSEGIVSFDPLIDNNPDQLWLFFMSYLNEKPTLSVNIHGYHVEVCYLFEFI
jgi:hypothetical protein